MHEDDLREIGDEHLAGSFTSDHSTRNRSASNFHLSWPHPLVTLNRIHRRAMECEARIPAKVRELPRALHRSECQTIIVERAFDSRDSRRAIGPNGGDRLVSMSVEQRPHDTSHLRFDTFEFSPRRHGDERIAASPGSLLQLVPIHICFAGDEAQSLVEAVRRFP